jgi:hypothetical protein
MDIEFKVQVDPKEISLERTRSCALFAAAMLIAVFLLLTLPTEILFLSAFFAGWVFERGTQSFRCYRGLLRQQKEPDRILVGDEAFIYCRRGMDALQIPFAALEKVSYADGVVFHFKKPSPARVVFLDPSFLLSRSRKAGDIHLPFFSPSVQARLQDIVHANQSYNASFL